MNRDHLLGFGVGILVGALAAWEAARRWERAAWALWWTSTWASEALRLTGRAAGWLLLTAAILTVGGVLIWWAL
ncbi:hypothetical protein ACN27J_03220 [Solwaraspora sp. WMMB762]|uniref:hypothetical protein n=1 Tax=Solwaraspora sp. WMMB762 TaxID=3404120 RepID=UPI003B929CC1